MKTTRKTFFSLILVLVMLLTSAVSLGTGTAKKADAVAQCDEIQSEIYYFSDSSPSFSNLLSSSAYYDVHTLMTHQEFAFLIYSGHFWGLDRTPVKCVIVEIKTMMPDQCLLEQLFKCLECQGLRVLFICPYIYDMGYTEGPISENIFAMPCNVDRYSRYIDNSIRYMNDSNIGNTLDPSTIFIDGRFVGLYALQEEYNLLDCWASPTLRRILYNIAYGEVDDQMDRPVYEYLWEYYINNEFIKEIGGCELNYFDGDTEIDDYIEFWKRIEEYYISSYGYGYDYEQWLTLKAGERNVFKAAVGVYYGPIVEEILERNIHILAHVEGNEYIDVIKVIDYSTIFPDGYDYFFDADVYHFSDHEEFYEIAEEYWFDVENIYAMAICRMQSGLYDFLKDMQDFRWTVLEPRLDLPVFLWLEDPIIWGDGLKVMIYNEIFDYYDDGLPYYDDDWLNGLFAEFLNELLMF